MSGRPCISKPASRMCTRRPLMSSTKRARMPGGRTAASSGRIFSGAQAREVALDEADEQRAAVGNGRVVEIVARVVHDARPLAVAVADTDEGPRHALQHLRKILRRHDQGGLPVDILVADQLGGGVGDKAGFVGMVDERWKEDPEIKLGL